MGCALNRSMKSRNFLSKGSVLKTHVDIEADFRAMLRFFRQVRRPGLTVRKPVMQMYEASALNVVLLNTACALGTSGGTSQSTTENKIQLIYRNL